MRNIHLGGGRRVGGVGAQCGVVVYFKILSSCKVAVGGTFF
jgi:hypothetical protein